MRMHRWFPGLLVVILIPLGLHAQPPGESLTQIRARAEQLRNDGNWKEAYNVLHDLALRPENDPKVAGTDLEYGLMCLKNLGTVDEADDFREGVVAVHSNSWRVLRAAAMTLYNGEHYGYVISGQFERGRRRSAGRYVNAMERDRGRALQLLQQALTLSTGDAEPRAVADLCTDFAAVLMGFRGYQDAWRLQALSDLATLPDYEEPYHHGGGNSRGAPVDEQNEPVYHLVPASWEAAQSDGERWRFLLNRAMELNPERRTDLRMTFAAFLSQQFGEQTLADYRFFFDGRDRDEDSQDTSGTWELASLSDSETIARLATGVRRLTLPDEFNYLRIYQEVAGEKGHYQEQALTQLATIHENRRQYEKAAAYWQRNIRECGPGNDNWKQARLDQIVKNWGTFETVMTHPAGRNATVEFRFRNGSSLALEAREIRVPELLADVKQYLRSNPRELDWDKVNVEQIGYRLVMKNQSQYVGAKVGGQSVALEPRPGHMDRRITLDTGLSKPGAYLLTATMDDGNTSRIIIWINDTVLVRKPLDKGVFFYVGDAVTGEPLPGMTLDLFGYRQNYVDDWKKLGRHYDVATTNQTYRTDAAGQVQLPLEEHANEYQWLITARNDGGRLAYLGFRGLWAGDYHDADYKETKVYGITDRPVYRPGQPVKLKFWIRHAQYDQPDTSDFARQDFAVIITDPQGQKIHEKTYTSDAYAGVSDEVILPKGAALGEYYAYIWQKGNSLGGVGFRVEEYKKPEFEVTVEAPTKPVMLGNSITATIRATYYFGAPVTTAKVKYKVLRSPHDARWYPEMPWDWFYGPGYWWFTYDYDWYPGWSRWGCMRPSGWWWPAHNPPPEIVAEGEIAIGADGTVPVTFDTALAKAVHGNQDHRYEITAEVTDASRRTIVGQGTVLVAREPFKVHAWVDRGHYRVGDVIQAGFAAQTLDRQPVTGAGRLTLYRVTYPNDQPLETAVQEWLLPTDAEGRAQQPITASEAGQYRLSYKVTDAEGHEQEGGYVFCVMGAGADARQFRFDHIELVPEKKEYAAGETLRLQINTDRSNATVVLFLRPSNGIYLPPRILHLKGKSAVEAIDVTKKDMPNFFVEAFTISDGKLYSDTREIVVPPEQRVLNVSVTPSATEYKPGAEASVAVHVTDARGRPFTGALVLAVYDKSVDYIAGGSNVGEIKAFFWKWRRQHSPTTESSLDLHFRNELREREIGMNALGLFGDQVADQDSNGVNARMGVGSVRRGMVSKAMSSHQGGRMSEPIEALDYFFAAPAAMAMPVDTVASADMPASGGEAGAAPQAEATVRKEFADTAYWNARLRTDANGDAVCTFTMPENLTGWKLRAWALGHGTKVGEGAVEVVTVKNLLLRLQAPRFFVEKDEVTLSANVHNYLASAKKVTAVLELDGHCLEPMGVVTQVVTIAAGGEQRVDWRVKVTAEGEAVVRMKALSDEESDAMEMRFPVYVHGMLKTESYSGVVRREADRAAITLQVPAARRPAQSRLELRYSPTLAGAMVDALPYLADYPYGCTEQTLNRFLPTVMVQKILKDMGLNLAAIREKRSNLNAQEIGNDDARAAQWKRYDREPVFDEALLTDMAREGLVRLLSMQVADGGWGWFSGWGEQSWPHTTAYTVRGLQLARQNGLTVPDEALDRGVQWLKIFQAEQLKLRRNAAREKQPYKTHTDALDAFVYLVLVEAGRDEPAMRRFLYEDRNDYSVYGKALLGLALHKVQDTAKLAMVMQNLEQFLVQDAENQSAYLKLPQDGAWWCWYGDEIETQACYLKLLAATDPKGDRAAGLVKYLLNNRKHATYWNSTRDTAFCIEALADYLRASGEAMPDMTVEIWMDGTRRKEARITAENLFTFDNTFVLEGEAITSGAHTVEVRRMGTGPVYFNAYLSNFTLEDRILRAGLEVKVNRTMYKLVPVDKTIKADGQRGQVLDQKVEKFERVALTDGATLLSGDLVEVELEVESKNDYEYILLEDMKAAGFEPVEVRSGYTGNELGAYVEYRDERVCLFVRQLARGRHSVTYRTRAEIPGRYSALPTRISAMYAPELKGNSDEIKLEIGDAPAIE